MCWISVRKPGLRKSFQESKPLTPVLQEKPKTMCSLAEYHNLLNRDMETFPSQPSEIRRGWEKKTLRWEAGTSKTSTNETILFFLSRRRCDVATENTASLIFVQTKLNCYSKLESSRSTFWSMVLELIEPYRDNWLDDYVTKSRDAILTTKNEVTWGPSSDAHGACLSEGNIHCTKALSDAEVYRSFPRLLQRDKPT